jgi:hypothetical protein
MGRGRPFLVALVAVPASAARTDETVHVPAGYAVKSVTTRTSAKP